MYTCQGWFAAIIVFWMAASELVPDPQLSLPAVELAADGVATADHAAAVQAFLSDAARSGAARYPPPASA